MGVSSTVPLLLRAARGEKVDRPRVDDASSGTLHESL